MNQVVVHITRGGVSESRHLASLAIVNATGQLLAEGGSSERLTFWRSAAKPVQILPLLVTGAPQQFGFTSDELAVMVASHSGETAHVQAVLSVLDKIGLGEESLRCGVHAPLYKPAAEALAKAGELPRALHCNCSGKHAGMWALARWHNWPTSGYTEIEHPVQRDILKTVAQVCGVPVSVIPLGVDGCGVPTYLLSLQAMAVAYARLASQNHLTPELAAAAAMLTAAMKQHPYMVGGTARLDTALMAACGGRLIAKSGSEGVFCVGWPQRNLGLTVKIEDGSSRALAPLVIEVLQRLGALTSEEAGSLADLHHPKVRTNAGSTVGSIETEIPEPLANVLARLAMEPIN